MAKITTSFVCQQCGASTSKWLGKCPNCGTWGSLVETIAEPSVSRGGKKAQISLENAQVIPLSQLEKKEIERSETGIAEFDRVLGGGIVPGMAVLLAGEPGIGKSTLMLELAGRLVKNQEARIKKQGKNTEESDLIPDTQYPILNTILYVAGEESPQQVKIRADRLGIGNLPIKMLAQTNVDVIAQVIEIEKPSIVLVDSVQTLKTEDLSSTFGSVGQVRECVDRLTMLCKRMNIPIFFIGHVTKEGTIAGPKVLEHIVDTVLMLEGDETHSFRILRTVKNRFGNTDEVGVFSMTEAGLTQVENPSKIFLAERLVNAPGSVVVPTMEGTRTILVEIQALTATTTLAFPRRIGNGIDYNRLQLLLAILSRKFSSELAKVDVFVNIAGGLKVNEPAIDLGVCLAVASAFNGAPIAPTVACYGEVGLLGEVRSVRFSKQRAQEAKRLGYDTVLGPDEVRSLSDALNKVFPKGKK